MKKLIALLLAMVMVLGLVACGGNTAEGGSVYYLNFKPEFDTALQELAKTYTEKTGVEVKIVTAASGTYSDTLNANIEDVTIYNIGNMAGLADWDDYALDLTGSAIAAALSTNDFNLYNEKGELKAILRGLGQLSGGSDLRQLSLHEVRGLQHLYVRGVRCADPAVLLHDCLVHRPRQVQSGQYLL